MKLCPVDNKKASQSRAHASVHRMIDGTDHIVTSVGSYCHTSISAVSLSSMMAHDTTAADPLTIEDEVTGDTYKLVVRNGKLDIEKV